MAAHRTERLWIVEQIDHRGTTPGLTFSRATDDHFLRASERDELPYGIGRALRLARFRGEPRETANRFGADVFVGSVFAISPSPRCR
jgi:hypothetical protein